jgi:hypothetical protein
MYNFVEKCTVRFSGKATRVEISDLNTGKKTIGMMIGIPISIPSSLLYR